MSSAHLSKSKQYRRKINGKCSGMLMGTDSALGKRPTPKKKHFRSGRLDQSIFNQIKKELKLQTILENTSITLAYFSARSIILSSYLRLDY